VLLGDNPGMPEPAQRRVLTDGPAIAVRDHPGGEPAVLALHGLASNARWWDLVAQRLGPEFRVIAPDLRGHGLSDAPQTGYGFEAVVADLSAVADSLHPDPLVVMGHSWGAAVGLQFAATLPERTLAVICVDGGVVDVKAFFGPSWELAEQAMRPPELRGISRSDVEAWMDRSALAEAAGRDAAVEILLGNFGPDPDRPGTLRPRLTLDRHMEIARSLYDLDLPALLAGVRCPVLFLPAGVPGDGTSLKERGIAAALHTLGDRAQATWIDGGHDLPVQRPDQVAAAVRRFIAGLPTRR
jgi:pimeloyl-ACP methyl ester carboxylesterase